MVESTLKQCLVIGDPIEQSMSPLMHNAAYRELGIESAFSFARMQVKAENLKHFLTTLADTVVGISVTIPHKIAVMELLDEISEDALQIGAVNTITVRNGKMSGCNTDWFGIVQPLKRHCKLQGKRALILGAGGAARSAVYGLLQEKVAVSIANRTASRAESLASDFEVQGVFSISEVPIADFDILVNTTSVGMSPDAELSPIPSSGLREGQIVFDAVYNPLETTLLRHANASACVTVSGVEMFVEQGARQFKLYTGKEAPVDTMRSAVLQELQNE
jgi:shikimate dehydrogenase